MAVQEARLGPGIQRNTPHTMTLHVNTEETYNQRCLWEAGRFRRWRSEIYIQYAKKFMRPTMPHIYSIAYLDRGRGPCAGLVGPWAGLGGLFCLVDGSGGFCGLPGRPGGIDIGLDGFGRERDRISLVSAALRQTTSGAPSGLNSN